jgi:hypothetical protein
MTRTEVNAQLNTMPISLDGFWLRIVVVVVLVFVIPAGFATLMRQQIASNEPQVPARDVANIKGRALMDASNVAAGENTQGRTSEKPRLSTKKNIRTRALSNIHGAPARDNIKSPALANIHGRATSDDLTTLMLANITRRASMKNIRSRTLQNIHGAPAKDNIKSPALANIRGRAAGDNILTCA